MNKKLIASSATILLALPAVLLAFDPIAKPVVIGSFYGIFDAIFNVLWPTFLAYSVIMFVVAGIQFLSAQGEPAGVARARQSVIYGTIGVGVALLSSSIAPIIKLALGV